MAEIPSWDILSMFGALQRRLENDVGQFGLNDCAVRKAFKNNLQGVCAHIASAGGRSALVFFAVGIPHPEFD